MMALLTTLSITHTNESAIPPPAFSLDHIVVDLCRDSSFDTDL